MTRKNKKFQPAPKPANTRQPLYLSRQPTAREVLLLREMIHEALQPRLRLRAKVILLMAETPGLCSGMASLKAGYDTRMPGQWWVRRFNQRGLAGLEDKPRPGRPKMKKGRK